MFRMIRENIVLSIWILKRKNIYSRTLRECVDWNLRLDMQILIRYRRTLRECVDWNGNIPLTFTRNKSVALFVSAWIETLKDVLKMSDGMMSHSSWVRGLKLPTSVISWLTLSSHSSWVRGLKHPSCSDACVWLCRTLRGCVDWNNKKHITSDAILIA